MLNLHCSSNDLVSFYINFAIHLRCSHFTFTPIVWSKLNDLDGISIIKTETKAVINSCLQVSQHR